MSTSYFKIRVGSLGALEPLPFDIFVLINGKHVHYLRSGDSITSEKLNSFAQKAADVLFVQNDQKEIYRNYVSRLIASDKTSPIMKAKILRESSLAMVEELFETDDVGQALSGSKVIIKSFMEFIDSDADGLAHLIGLSSHDFYTYNHSLDVGVYGLGLGQLAGYSGKELQELGEGALFHDIGKRNIDVQIICKTGPLSESEWTQMQMHPQYGLKILDEHNVSEGIKACCFEHHESFLGNGYPQRLVGEDIHPMARVVAICDTYDALTTKRSYSMPMTPKDALNFMTTKLSGRYDQNLLKAMYEVMFKM